MRDLSAEAGWDVRTNTSTRDEPPTLEELLGFLDGTIETLETFDLPTGGPRPKSSGDKFVLGATRGRCFSPCVG